MNNKYLNISHLIQDLNSIDYNQIINIITPISIGFISTILLNKQLDNYKIYRESKYKKKTIKIELPPNIEYKEFIINNNPSNTNYHNLLITFINTLEKNFNENELILLYNNLTNLKIYSLDDFKKLSRTLGKNTLATYDSINNIIYLSKEYKGTIFHELFHTASSYYDQNKNIIYSGFMQIKKNKTIGKALTEGYTQKITEKYFKDDYNIMKSYPIEKKISKNLELIIGNFTMEKLYLEANLFGLINILSQYNNINNIQNFLFNMDFIMYYNEQEKKSNFTINSITNKLKSINVFLVETYINKLLFDYHNELISQETANDNLIMFLANIPTSLTIDNNKYIINDIDELLELSKNIKNNYHEKKLIKH